MKLRKQTPEELAYQRAQAMREKLTKRVPFGRRVRVGDFRILYQIDDTAETVAVVRVRHRRDVYR